MSSLIFIQTIYARKIKSNIENILQILWEREAEAKEQAALDKLIYANNDKEVFEEEEGEIEPVTEAETRNLKSRKQRETLLEKAPKIIRLKSKVCKILSDHEDVLDFDAYNYPPGTNKISKFIALDVE